MKTYPEQASLLDLGCGENKHPGAIGLDNASLPGVDIVRDLTDIPYPFESGTVDKIYCNQVLDHFDYDRRLDILREIHRLLPAGGILELSVMHAQCLGYLQDPTHKSTFSFKSMEYFQPSFYWHYYKSLDIGFEIVSRRAYMELGLKKILGEKAGNYINRIGGRILTCIADFSGMIGDYLVRIFPFYWVEIYWVLQKSGDDT